MTPTLIEIQERHRAFHANIAAQAKPDTGISCRSASGRVPANDPPLGPSAADIARWTERQKAIPLPVVKEPLFSIIEGTDITPHKIGVREIQIVVCRHFKIRLADMLSQRRTRDLTRPRQVAGYFAKMLTPLSYPAIGRYFGGRDHSTQIHAVRKTETLIQTDPLFKAKVEEIARELGGNLD